MSRHEHPEIAVLAVAGALFAVVFSTILDDRQGERLDTVEAQVLVLDARLADLTPPPTPRTLTYAEWRALESPRVVTEEEMVAALTAAGMPATDAAVLARAAAACEAPARDRDGTSMGAHMDRPGDDGRALTAFQIRRDVHPEKIAGRDLALLADAAAVAVAISTEARQLGRPALSPWACVPR